MDRFRPSRFTLRGISSRHPRIVNIALLVGSLVVAFWAIEFSFRGIICMIDPPLASTIRMRIAIASTDESARAYSPHPYLSYAPSDMAYADNGLRIGERYFSTQKRAGTIRVACLGGSTTMRKYTQYLDKDLERFSLGRNFEVMDFGCTGWTLMESTIDYMIRVSDFSPDVVLVHHGMNDSFPMIWPDFKPDYSHYRISWHDQSGWLDSRFLSRSWFFSYVQIRRGMRRTALRNYTVYPVDDRELSYTPIQAHLETYRSNLKNLVTLIRTDGGEAVFAPMAYQRGKIAEKYGPLIDKQNECMREVASEMNVSLAETDGVLSSHSNLYTDIVHINRIGIRIQSLLYAPAIWNALQEPDIQPDVVEIVDTLTQRKTPIIKRELEIRWTIELPEIRDFHVYVFDEFAMESIYLGRTGNGSDRVLIWKANAPFIAKRFAEGPAIGRTYRFQVYAILQNGDSLLLICDRPDQIQTVNRYVSDDRKEKQSQ